MDITSSTIVFIAFGLAMDSFAVSTVSGMAIRQQRINNALKIAISFGSFQAVMPLLGWLAGHTLTDLILGVDHWIAFGLLCLIGLRMIYESIEKESNKKKIDPLNFCVLLALSITTSIDALAVGVGFAFLRIPILIPIIVIGSVTFLLSFLGVLIGGRSSHFAANKIKILGGLVLIGIGTRILLEHLLNL